MPDSTNTPYDPLNPQATPPSTMRNIMARYHADIGAQVDYTLADLQARWAPVRAALDQEIRRLTQQMEQALAHGDTLSESWLNEAQRLTTLKGLVEGNVAEFAAAARSGIGAAQLQAIQSGTEAAQAALQGVVPPGVNYTFGVPPDDVLHQLAGAVQPYSPLSNLFEEFGPQAAQNAADALFTSVALGENPRLAAERLEIATNMPARRAEVIARTEILRSWRGAQLANYRANSDVVQGWEWLADFGPRCCSACLAMDGTVHPLEEELDDHICGRCSAAPLTGSWSSILRDAGVAEEDIPQSLREVDEVALAGAGGGRQTGEEWLRGQSTEVQNLIMGPAKAEAWRQGAISLSETVGVRHDPVWGSSIQELSLKQMGWDAQSWLTAAREGGSGSMLAEDEALSQAHAESFATTADRLAQAKAAADDWYAQIERSIAGSGASPERLAEVQAQAADWYAQVEQRIARGDTAGVLDYSNPDSMWSIRREEAIAVAEGRAEFLSSAPQTPTAEEEGFALKEPPTATATDTTTYTREALSDKSMAELRQIAKEVGASPARSKAETIDRILAKSEVKAQQATITPAVKPAESVTAPTNKAAEKLAALRTQVDERMAARDLLYREQHDLVAEQDRLINVQRDPQAILDNAERRAMLELYHASLDRANPEVRTYLKDVAAYTKLDTIQADMARLQETMDRLATAGQQTSKEFAEAKAAYAALEKANTYAARQKAWSRLWERAPSIYKPELSNPYNWAREFKEIGVTFSPAQIERSAAMTEARALMANLDTRLAAVKAQIASVDKDIATANKQIKRDLAQLDKLSAEVRGSAAVTETLDTMRPFSDVIELPEGHQPPNQLMQKMDYKMREPRAVTKRRIINDIDKRLRNNPDWQEYIARTPLPDRLGVYHDYIDWHADPNDSKSAALVADWIKKWGVGYRPGSPEWVAMQLAVREEFGLDAAIHTAAANAPGGERYYAENGAAIRALMRAMYDNTQQWFADNGITEIEVYRGFGWKEMQQELVPKGINWGPVERPNYGVADLELNPFQSFSADINVSQGTGSGNGFAGGGFGGGSDYSLLVGAKIPVDRVLGTAQTGFGAKLESEIVVMGRATDSVSYRASTKVEEALLQQAEEQTLSPRETLYTAPDGTVVHVAANADGTYTATLQAGLPLESRWVSRKIGVGDLTESVRVGTTLKVGKSKTYKTVEGVNKLLKSARIANTYVAPDVEGLAVREGEEAVAAAGAEAADGLRAQVEHLSADATVADAQDWLKAQLPEHASVDLMSLDAPAARLVANALGNLLPEMPEVAAGLERVAVQATRDGALAYVTPDGAALVLNADKWADAAALASLAERAPTYAAQGWWVAQTPEQALGHELGHLAQLHYGILNETWSAALERVAAAGGDPLVSQYAGDKLEESFAETFALLVYGQPSEAQLPIVREMATLLRANGLDYTTLRAAVGSAPLDLQ